MVNPELYPLTPPHVFEIVTQQVTYYVGVDMTGALPMDLRPSNPVDCEYQLERPEHTHTHTHTYSEVSFPAGSFISLSGTFF